MTLIIRVAGMAQLGLGLRCIGLSTGSRTPKKDRGAGGRYLSAVGTCDGPWSTTVLALS